MTKDHLMGFWRSSFKGYKPVGDVVDLSLLIMGNALFSATPNSKAALL